MNDFYKEELLKSLISSEFKPEIIKREKVNLSLFDSIPFADLSVLGASFVPLLDSLQKVGSQLIGTGAQQTETLYRATLPEGAASMSKVKGSSEFIGAARGSNGLGQTRFTPVEVSNNSVNGSVSQVPKLNPYMLVVAAALMSVNMKLNDIKQFQNKMIEFLEQKEQAKLEGNLSYLSDILNNYKLNWNNERYISTNHIKVSDIKQEAEQSINLFQKQVKSIIDDDSVFHSTKKTNSVLNNLLSSMTDYRLSIYLYAFSSYVEVLFLSNFESVYLQSVTDKILNYSLEYRVIFTDLYAAFEKYANKSLRSIASRGASGVAKGLGSVADKLPKVKETQLGEKLSNKAGLIKDWNINNNTQIARNLASQQKADVSVFIDSIEKIDYLYNRPLNILISKDTLYIENEHKN